VTAFFPAEGDSPEKFKSFVSATEVISRIREPVGLEKHKGNWFKFSLGLPCKSPNAPNYKLRGFTPKNSDHRNECE
jgi:hypothetical protein